MPARSILSLNTAAVIKWSIVAFLMFNIITAPLHYLLGAAGLFVLGYLPKLELIGLILFFIISGRAKTTEFYGALALLAVFVLVGLNYLPNPIQPIFGIWVISPVLFTLLASRSFFLDFESYRRIFLAMFIIVVTGVFVNEFYNFPWANQSFEIAGQSVAASRSWSVQGVSRIAGFSGASFYAATQIIILAVFVIQNEKRKIFAAGIWLIAGAAIALTTSKGPILAYAVLTSLVFTRIFLDYLGPVLKLLFSVFINALAVLVVSVMILVPLSTLGSAYKVGSASRLQELLFASFQIRLTQTWPDALAPLNSAASFLFGRGIGAIGVTEFYFDPLNYNSADNLFLYILAQLGLILTVAILLYLTAKFLTVGGSDDLHTTDFTFRALWMLVMIIGCTANVIEDPFLSMALGFCLAYRKSWKGQMHFQTRAAETPIGGPVGLTFSQNS